MPIQLELNAVVITGQDAEVVRGGLTSTVKQFRTQNGNLYALPPSEHPHYVCRDGGSIAVHACLLPRARQLLAAAGIEPVVAGCKPIHQEPAWAVCEREGLPLPTRKLALALATNRCGQVSYHQADDARMALATLIQTYPAQRVLIVGRRRHELKGLARWLTRQTGTRVYTDYRAAFAVEQRKFIVTTAIFETANNDDWDVVVFLAPDAVLGKSSLPTAQRIARNAHTYCLRPAGAALSHHEELLLESAVGPVIYRLPGQRGELCSVQVLTVDGSHKPIAGRYGSVTPAVELKRALYWHNTYRNQLVATVATAISSADVSTLTLHIPELRRTEINLHQPTVSILVQNREHALQLTELLPNWPLVCVNGTQLPQRQSIVTELAATKLDITSNFVINASGNELTSQICFPAALDDVQGLAQYLLDFTDDFHTLAQARSQTRFAMYRAADFQVIN